MAELRETIGDEAVAPGDEVRTHLGNFPTGQIAVDAVEERAVVVKLRRERLEEVRGFEDVLHAVVDVALEDHRRLGIEQLASAAEGAVGHIALHDLDGVGVLVVHARNLVEGDAVPVAHQADAARARHVIGKQHRGGCLSAGEQVGIGRYLGIDMRFARAARPQFAEVVVELDERNHADEEVHALARGERAGFVTGGAQDERDPFIGGELTAPGDDLVDIEVGHLDRREVDDVEWRVLRTLAVFRGPGLDGGGWILAKDIGKRVFGNVFGTQVLDARDAPNAAGEHLGVLAHILVGHDERLDGEVGEVRHVDIAALVEIGAHLVDDGVLPQLANTRLDDLALLGAHVVFGKDLADAREPLVKRGGVIGGAIGAQQVFQDKRGDARAALHEGGEVFAHDEPGEVAYDLTVEFVLLVGGGGDCGVVAHGYHPKSIEGAKATRIWRSQSAWTSRVAVLRA